MKKTGFGFLMLTAALGLLAPARAHAGLLDWISKLSGPSILSIGFSQDLRCLSEDKWWWCLDGEQNRTLRGTVAFGEAVANEPVGLSGKILVWQLGLSHVWTYPEWILEAGGHGLRFEGSGFEDFDRFALVGTLYRRVELGAEVELQVGARAWYFTEGFTAGDFGIPDSRETGDELTWGLIARVAWR